MTRDFNILGLPGSLPPPGFIKTPKNDHCLSNPERLKVLGSAIALGRILLMMVFSGGHSLSNIYVAQGLWIVFRRKEVERH